MTTKPETPIWRKWTYFAECPHCKHVEALGEDLNPEERYDTSCTKCGKEYTETWEDPS